MPAILVNALLLLICLIIINFVADMFALDKRIKVIVLLLVLLAFVGWIGGFRL
jgi:hypothetical protein